MNFVANKMVRREIDARDASGFAQLGRCALDAYRAGQLAEQVEQLERRFEADQGHPTASPSYPYDFVFEKKTEDESAAGKGSRSTSDGGGA
jgi:hypothetical protein